MTKVKAAALMVTILAVSGCSPLRIEMDEYRESPERIPQGSRVVVMTQEGGKFKGVITHVDDASIAVEDGLGRSETFPLERVKYVELLDQTGGVDVVKVIMVIVVVALAPFVMLLWMFKYLPAMPIPVAG